MTQVSETSIKAEEMTRLLSIQYADYETVIQQVPNLWGIRRKAALELNKGLTDEQYNEMIELIKYCDHQIKLILLLK